MNLLLIDLCVLGFEQQICFLSSRGLKSKIKVLAGSVSSEASPLALQVADLSFVTPQGLPSEAWHCLDILFLQGHPSSWIRAHSHDLIYP